MRVEMKIRVGGGGGEGEGRGGATGAICMSIRTVCYFLSSDRRQDI